MESHDLVLSSQSKRLEWQGPASASGLRFGGVFGHVYTELNSAFEQGLVKRDDAPDDESNLLKLQKQRIDFLFLQDHAASYYLHRKPAMMENIYISRTKRSDKPYSLRILMKFRTDADQQALKNIIGRMPQDAEWQTILRRYGLSGQTQPARSLQQ